MVCGLALFTASLLSQTLPETQNLPLYNHLQDPEARSNSNPEERVSLRNCVAYNLYKKFKKRRQNNNESNF